MDTYKPFDIEVKRFHVPFKIVGNCPECGDDFEVNYEQDYLSYPTVNAEMPLDLYHYSEKKGEDCEFTVKVRLMLSMVIMETVK